MMISLHADASISYNDFFQNTEKMGAHAQEIKSAYFGADC